MEYDGGERRARRRAARLKRRLQFTFVLLLLVFFALSGAAVYLYFSDDPPVIFDSGPEITVTDAPEWVEKDYLPVNRYSRPGTALREVNAVVIHYVGNPATTAKQNHNYFKNLADTGETYASSHFIVGLEGEIIQCIPLNEIAYCTSERNADTVAIEVCHPDETGEFNDATVESLTRLVKWLCGTFSLDRDGVIRHYDATGKECPLYYVRSPDEWERLLDKFFAEG